MVVVVMVVVTVTVGALLPGCSSPSPSFWPKAVFVSVAVTVSVTVAVAVSVAVTVALASVWKDARNTDVAVDAVAMGEEGEDAAAA